MVINLPFAKNKRLAESNLNTFERWILMTLIFQWMLFAGDVVCKVTTLKIVQKALKSQIKLACTSRWLLGSNNNNYKPISLRLQLLTLWKFKALCKITNPSWYKKKLQLPPLLMVLKLNLIYQEQLHKKVVELQSKKTNSLIELNN